MRVAKKSLFCIQYKVNLLRWRFHETHPYIQIYQTLRSKAKEVLMKQLLVSLFLVAVVATSSSAQGVYWGSKAAPLAYFLGDVMKVVKKGPPIKMEETNIPVKLVKAYYTGNIIQDDLAKPTEGGVEEVFIGDTPIALKSKDISKGFLQTEKYGDIQILFDANSLRCYLLVTEEQLRNLKKPPALQATAKDTLIPSPIPAEYQRLPLTAITGKSGEIVGTIGIIGIPPNPGVTANTNAGFITLTTGGTLDISFTDPATNMFIRVEITGTIEWDESSHI
ncbi:MAG: hypothetical protein ACREBU_20695, partial [Nitrososphaera sp.]